MRRRNLFAVFILPFFTLGIYSLFWYAENRGQMNRYGANVPTTWWIIVPIINIWWLWRFSKGVSQVTKQNTVVAFIILLLLASLGMTIVQSSFNYVAGDSHTATSAPPVA